MKSGSRPAFRIGIVGHRHFATREARGFAARHCLDILRRAQAARAEVAALSALAAGADTFFAQSALALGIRLEVVRPFARYAEDFAPPPAERLYARLRAAASVETCLPYESRCEPAYAAAMDWVVDHSDLLVAVWGGGPGLTARAVGRATSRGRPWLHVNTLDLSVESHAGDPAPAERRAPPPCQFSTASSGSWKKSSSSTPSPPSSSS